ncbi:MAG: RNA 2'-phosphotransferase [Halobacteriales archaeon]|nr:RNA 2'-phosphotransferase [Halobacteriales archaeon]
MELPAAMPVEVEPLSRTLAHALRHEPHRHGIALDEHGWAALEQVVERLRLRRYPELTRVDVERAVREDPRQRFEVADGRIRATYGHSVHIAPGEVAKPPTTLYAAVPRAVFRGVAMEGLHPPAPRAFVHLTEQPDAAREVAQRKDKEPILLEVAARDAAKEGIVFRHSGEVWLTDEVPARFLQARG